MQYPVVRVISPTSMKKIDEPLDIFINQIWNIRQKALQPYSSILWCKIGADLFGVYGNIWVTINKTEIIFLKPITGVKCTIWSKIRRGSTTLLVQNEGYSHGQIPCSQLAKTLRGISMSVVPDRPISRATELRLKELRNGQPVDCLFRNAPKDSADIICHCNACAVLSDLIRELRAFNERHAC